MQASASIVLSVGMCLTSRCDTTRRNRFMFGFIVRHTPHFVRPSPRGDGLPHHFDYQWSAAAPSPLGEGWP